MQGGMQEAEIDQSPAESQQYILSLKWRYTIFSVFTMLFLFHMDLTRGWWKRGGGIFLYLISVLMLLGNWKIMEGVLQKRSAEELQKWKRICSACFLLFVLVFPIVVAHTKMAPRSRIFVITVSAVVMFLIVELHLILVEFHEVLRPSIYIESLERWLKGIDVEMEFTGDTLYFQLIQKVPPLGLLLYTSLDDPWKSYIAIGLCTVNLGIQITMQRVSQLLSMQQRERAVHFWMIATLLLIVLPPLVLFLLDRMAWGSSLGKWPKIWHGFLCMHTSLEVKESESKKKV